MDTQNRIRPYQTSCPASSRIEKILLRAHRHPARFRKFQQHLVVCQNCQRVVKRIQLFYEILEGEMVEPCSPRVVDFVKSINSGVQSK